MSKRITTFKGRFLSGFTHTRCWANTTPPLAALAACWRRCTSTPGLARAHSAHGSRQLGTCDESYAGKQQGGVIEMGRLRCPP